MQAAYRILIRELPRREVKQAEARPVVFTDG